MENSELVLIIGEKIEKGNAEIHKKIDSKVDALRADLLNHQIGCHSRFQKIETDLKVSTAIKEVTERADELASELDIWPKLKTAIVIAASLAVIAAAAKIFLAHSDLIK